MSGLPWFRMYTDFLNDPKIISLAFEDQRHFIGILALKSEGVIDHDCEIKLLDRIVAQRLWVDFAIITDVKKRLCDAGLINDYWQPLAWHKRQCISDKDPSGAERQRRYRDKNRNALRNVTYNVAITPPDKIRVEENILEKNREDSLATKKKGSRLSEEWFLPKDYGEWALTKGLTESEIKRESESFKDYWISLPGNKAVKLDWFATWRNWIRNSLKRGVNNNARKKFDPMAEVYERVRADRENFGPSYDPFRGDVRGKIFENDEKS